MRDVHLNACAALCAALAASLGGCTSDTPKADACDWAALADLCGKGCEVDADCGDGTYCDGEACTADCVSGHATLGCGEGKVCGVDGRCLGGGDGGKGDGGKGDAGGGDGGDADGGDGGDGSTPENVCPRITLAGDPVTPNVVLIIDQSSSMNAAFGDDGETRWTALKDTLLADDGLIAELDDVVRFGVVLYSSANHSGETVDPPPVDDPCPMLTTVPVSFDGPNLQNIRDVYEPAPMIEDTPTGEAIEQILDEQLDAGVVVPPGVDTKAEPTVFILATDGEPDTCAVPDPQNGQPEAIAAVERAYSLGVRTYVIAVAEEDQLPQVHVDDLANAGVGLDPGPGDPAAESFRVNDQDGLRQALLDIVGGALSCEVPLTTGRVVADDPCAGTVTLGGNPLACDDPDGWSLLDPETIEVRGMACDELKKGAVLSAEFECDEVMLF